MALRSLDLMIGDWVRLVGNELHSYQIEEIRKEHGIYRYFLKDTKVFATEDEIEPIPLTPEILVKSGFEVQEQGGGRQDVWNGFGKDNENDIEVEFSGGAPVHVKIDGCGFHFTSGKIHYVHELQHSLKNCGIEKEIKLED